MRTLIELAVNLAGPWLAYTLIKPHASEVMALIASAAPPTLWSFAELIRHRKVDALSLIVLASIALSALALILGGSPRMLLVRENIFSIPLGLAFLMTAPFGRPLIYYLARSLFARESAARADSFEGAWRRPHVLHGLQVMSAVWGLGLIAQGAFLGWAAWAWRIPVYLALSPVIGYGSIGALGLWTYLYQQRLAAHSQADNSASAAAAISA